MGKSVAERRWQRTVPRNVMWPATFLPFVSGFGFTPPQQKTKRERKKSKQNKKVAATETHVHVDGNEASTVTADATSVTANHEATSVNAAAEAGTDFANDPIVDMFSKATAFGYEDAWPYSSFTRPGVSD